MSKPSNCKNFARTVRQWARSSALPNTALITALARGSYVKTLEHVQRLYINLYTSVKTELNEWCALVR